MCKHVFAGLSIFNLKRNIQVWLPPNEQGSSKKSSSLNAAMTTIASRHNYNNPVVYYNDMGNKKVELTDDLTQDWTQTPDWIQSGAVFQPVVGIQAQGWSNSCSIALHFEELYFLPVDKISECKEQETTLAPTATQSTSAENRLKEIRNAVTSPSSSPLKRKRVDIDVD